MLLIKGRALKSGRATKHAAQTGRFVKSIPEKICKTMDKK